MVGSSRQLGPLRTETRNRKLDSRIFRDFGKNQKSNFWLNCHGEFFATAAVAQSVMRPELRSLKRGATKLT